MLKVSLLPFLQCGSHSRLRASFLGTDITAGHLLCSGLVSSDPLVVWFSCCILLHCVLDAPPAEKERLLRVQMATGVGSPPVSLIQQVGAVLTQARDLQVRLAVLMLLSGWLTNSPASVSQFLQHSAHVPYVSTESFRDGIHIIQSFIAVDEPSLYDGRRRNGSIGVWYVRIRIGAVFAV